MTRLPESHPVPSPIKERHGVRLRQLPGLSEDPFHLLDTPISIWTTADTTTRYYAANFPHVSLYGHELAQFLAMATSTPKQYFSTNQMLLGVEGTIDDLFLPQLAKSGGQESMRLMAEHGTHLGPEFGYFIRFHNEAWIDALYTPGPKTKPELMAHAAFVYTTKVAREELISHRKREPFTRNQLTAVAIRNREFDLNIELLSPGKPLTENGAAYIHTMPIPMLEKLMWPDAAHDRYARYGCVIDLNRGAYVARREEMWPLLYDGLTISYDGENTVMVKSDRSCVPLLLDKKTGRLKIGEATIHNPRQYALGPLLAWSVDMQTGHKTYYTHTLPAPLSGINIDHGNLAIGLVATSILSPAVRAQIKYIDHLDPKEGNQFIREAQIGVQLARKSDLVVNESPLFTALEQAVINRV